MKTYPLRIKLLSPFFNYAYATNEGALTSEFIGDIALAYALNRALKQQNFYSEFRKKPFYQELRNLDYCFTVARPLLTRRTGIYIRATQFNCDGGPDYDIIGREGNYHFGKNLFKNTWKVQGIAPESEFSCWMLCKESFKIQLPFAIRLGTHRECLAVLEKDINADEENIWLNAYSLKEIFGEEAVQRFIETRSYSVDFKLQHYILLKNLQLNQVKGIFNGVF